tara:strand:- start:1667 stop:2698 length:1032 start_codon:yes stop_codon:yes gene_type:complete
MVWLNTNATRLKRWFGERHIVSYTIIAANASGVAFAIRHYYKEQEDADHRRQDQEALASLDRAAAFSNARLTERSVLELESYRWKLEAEERERVQQRKKWRWLGAAETPERRWADVWMEHRCALDRNAAEMEARRIELKNLWYVSKQAWDTHPQRHNLMMDFFFDAPLNATLAHRCLHLLEDMDIARFDLLDRKYDRPTIYSFIEKLCTPLLPPQAQRPRMPSLMHMLSALRVCLGRRRKQAGDGRRRSPRDPGGSSVPPCVVALAAAAAAAAAATTGALAAATHHRPVLALGRVAGGGGEVWVASALETSLDNLDTIGISDTQANTRSAKLHPGRGGAYAEE